MARLIVTSLIGLVLWTSCKPSQPTFKKISFSPTQNGFGVVVQNLGVDTGPGAQLYYKGTNNSPILVWPYIGTWGDPIIYSNDIALLLADKPDEAGRLGHGALICIQGTGPALEISADVLKTACDQNLIDFRKALRICSPASLNQDHDGTIIVYYGGNSPNNPEFRKLKARIMWRDVFEIMQSVRRSGKTHKITNTDVVYLEQDYGL